ncbi:uncharacterized protein MONBRDRAFT_31521 [Monosiga brevicollis MX1]|uniref:Uncharacterized protein n=1 Tax=Monosiga brevicollis TaxID=81824 RepID=A9UTR1_MONBE|nr:uncharacterized protein MONBRDRAFT_31521 [Monosiga brevicollis MX1]EDQ91534.1 predicted protein [Monosiga brevicollis MX1]|eukprot:XP_001743956.1 hypothetical protein [Monosiga brevicollis MX1]
MAAADSLRQMSMLRQRQQFYKKIGALQDQASHAFALFNSCLRARNAESLAQASLRMRVPSELRFAAWELLMGQEFMNKPHSQLDSTFVALLRTAVVHNIHVLQRLLAKDNSETRAVWTELRGYLPPTPALSDAQTRSLPPTIRVSSDMSVGSHSSTGSQAAGESSTRESSTTSLVARLLQTSQHTRDPELLLELFGDLYAVANGTRLPPPPLAPAYLIGSAESKDVASSGSSPITSPAYMRSVPAFALTLFPDLPTAFWFSRAFILRYLDPYPTYVALCLRATFVILQADAIDLYVPLQDIGIDEHTGILQQWCESLFLDVLPAEFCLIILDKIIASDVMFLAATLAALLISFEDVVISCSSSAVFEERLVEAIEDGMLDQRAFHNLTSQLYFRTSQIVQL